MAVSITGVLVITIAFAGMLWGFSSATAGFYCVHCWRNDKKFLRVAVVLVWVVDTFHFLSFVYTSPRLSLPPVMMLTEAAVAWVEVVPKHAYLQFDINEPRTMFYLQRIYAFGRNIWTAILLGLLVAANFAMSIVITYKAILGKTLLAYLRLQLLAGILAALTAASDIALTGWMIYLLMKSRGHGPRSRRLINRLLLYSLNSGFVTTVLALLALLTLFLSPTTGIFSFFFNVGARTYPLSMYSSLNAREGLRHTMARGEPIATVPITVTVTRRTDSGSDSGSGPAAGTSSSGSHSMSVRMSVPRPPPPVSLTDVLPRSPLRVALPPSVSSARRPTLDLGSPSPLLSPSAFHHSRDGWV
ncbi:uncharacterized protein BXZ73DRAFT_96386 [Epithele typhae]|uniref:uncharacterized protein n=1 Tax=Epithele typhae TaxID=378194 RepID=UPI0020089132|nr:uncharacterized protein BXZ73DRAFT_96386 [Epithele typhae]KAH9945395.1 hypothetical protein BXZ73DRAFT_96386 [Epithele typhae]